MTTQKRVLLLGVGSPFGADRIGWLAVAALENSGLAARFPQLTLRFEQSDRPGSRLIGLLESADMTIIVDAMQSGEPNGTVRCFALDELSATTGLASSHGFGVIEALALAKQLDALPPEIIVMGIEVAEETEAESLLEYALDTIEAMVREMLSGGGRRSNVDTD